MQEQLANALRCHWQFGTRSRYHTLKNVASASAVPAK